MVIITKPYNLIMSTYVNFLQNIGLLWLISINKVCSLVRLKCIISFFIILPHKYHYYWDTYMYRIMPWCMVSPLMFTHILLIIKTISFFWKAFYLNTLAIHLTNVHSAYKLLYNLSVLWYKNLPRTEWTLQCHTSDQ